MDPIDLSILVFSKTPDSPEAKTRLKASPDFSSEFIQSLHSYFVQETLSLINKSCRNHKRFVAWYPGANTLSAIDCAIKFPDFNMFSQSGANFVQRFINSLSHVRKKANSAVIVVGTDCPFLSTDILNQAVGELNSNSLVIGPNSNKGFYLLGISDEICLNKLSKCLQIDDEVNAIISEFSNTGVQILPELMDIDSPQDLAGFLAEKPLLEAKLLT